MKISLNAISSLCVFLTVAQSNVGVVSAAWGWGSSTDSSSSTVITEEVDIDEFAAAVPTKVNNRSLKTIIADERRFVLFNSRRLSGECLPICSEPAPTKRPTDSPSELPKTKNPTKSPTKSPSANPTTAEPTDAPTNKPTDEPTNKPTDEPTNKPSKAPTMSPTKFPTKSPTKFPTANPTATPTRTPTNKPTPTPPPKKTGTPTRGFEEGGTMDCEKFVNLGYGFSEATSMEGMEHYHGKCYPSVKSLPSSGNGFPGRDDSVAVFVGGSYYGKKAAEVEGNMVVLGDLIVESNGPGNFVSVGVGSNVIPNNGGECIKVGGNIKANRNIQVFNQYDLSCDMVYKKEATNLNKWKTNGKKRYDPNMDLSEYENMKTVLRKKSQYWKTLKSTGTVTESYTTTTFTCSKKDEVQVFNIQDNNGDKNKINGAVTSYRFSPDCEDQTILINVHGNGDLAVSAVDFKDHNNKFGYGDGGFSTCMTANILWNIPDAKSVDIGNKKTSEFQGSLLVGGDMTMTTTGQSGRTMVLGDITHNKGGSEFHSYEFNPPTPLPFDPNDISCADFIGGGGGGGLPIGKAGRFAVMSQTGITMGASGTINGDVMSYPTKALTGFVETMNDGKTYYTSDAVDGYIYATGISNPEYLTEATAEVKDAYDYALTLPTDTFDAAAVDLIGKTYKAGVYKWTGAISLTGTVTFDGSDTDVFIMITAAAFSPAANSKVVFTGGAKAENLFWVLGAALTAGANSDLHGVVLCAAAMTVGANAEWTGALLAFGAGGFLTMGAGAEINKDSVCVPGSCTSSAVLVELEAETKSPTKYPTSAPKVKGCKKKGNESNGVNDSNCSTCDGTIQWQTWPCEPKLCEGSGCVYYK